MGRLDEGENLEDDFDDMNLGQEMNHRSSHVQRGRMSYHPKRWKDARVLMNERGSQSHSMDVHSKELRHGRIVFHDGR